MGLFDLDFSSLHEAVDPDRIPLRGNEHRITRVAFDLFKLDSDKENLWQIQADDDGNEFLVRTYEMPSDEVAKGASDWSVVEDGKKASLTVAYLGVPIHRLVAAEYGAGTPEEVGLLRDLVQAKLADADFAGKMLASMPEPKRAALAAAFPKLATALPKIKPVSGKDPLEGIEPLDIKKEWGIDPKAKSNLPPSGDWEKYPKTKPQMADEGSGKPYWEQAGFKTQEEYWENHGKQVDEGLQRLEKMKERRYGKAIDEVASIAKEMGHSGTFERHDLPMIVFYFHQGDAQAKEFLNQVEKKGHYGCLVGPGWAAVKLPGL